jgi:hypothetical protein
VDRTKAGPIQSHGTEGQMTIATATDRTFSSAARGGMPMLL